MQTDRVGGWSVSTLACPCSSSMLEAAWAGDEPTFLFAALDCRLAFGLKAHINFYGTRHTGCDVQLRASRLSVRLEKQSGLGHLSEVLCSWWSCFVWTHGHEGEEHFYSCGRWRGWRACASPRRAQLSGEHVASEHGLGRNGGIPRAGSDAPQAAQVASRRHAILHAAVRSRCSQKQSS